MSLETGVLGLLSWMFEILAVIWISLGGPGPVRFLSACARLLMGSLRLVRCR